MLQEQTVTPELLELLKKLMAEDSLNAFTLVGGTSIALQLGHRVSVDIDLFGNSSVDELEIAPILQNIGTIQLINKSKNVLIYLVDNIKVDFVNYSYQWLKPAVEIQGIRLASKEDIAAMKLSAIAGRGSKKDFVDLVALMDFFTLQEMIGFYLQKFPDGSEFMVLKSLVYFEDADNEPNPVFILNQNWEEIKNRIKEEVSLLN